MPECFVTLDKYKNDISRQQSRDKLLIEHLERHLKDVDIAKPYANELIEQYHYIIGLLREPLGFWFTQQEWSQPLSASRERFSSVSDGVQTSWFDDIGENPYPLQGKLSDVP